MAKKGRRFPEGITPVKRSPGGEVDFVELVSTSDDDDGRPRPSPEALAATAEWKRLEALVREERAASERRTRREYGPTWDPLRRKEGTWDPRRPPGPRFDERGYQISY